MCVRCIISKTAWLHGIGLGDRCESKEGRGHCTVATTSNLKRNPKGCRHDAALSQFISKLGEHGFNRGGFHWDDPVGFISNSADSYPSLQATM
jgi:hypothetical protein